MIWVLIGAFVFGTCFGAVLMGAFCANEPKHNHYEDRWWDDE